MIKTDNEIVGRLDGGNVIEVKKIEMKNMQVKMGIVVTKRQIEMIY